MTATGHALVGAAIGSQISNPWISLPLAFLSHFLGDKLPHWDAMTDKTKPKSLIIAETIADVLIGYTLVALIFVYFLNVSNPANVFLAAFTAQLPDWIEGPYSVLRIKGALFEWNYKMQSWIHHVWFDSRLKAPWGVVTQVVVVAIFLLWVFT